MVSRKLLLTIAVFIFTIAFSTELLGQTVTEYYPLKKYRKWGIVAGPILYNRATLEPRYGEYTFKNKPMLGYNAGFEYDF